MSNGDPAGLDTGNLGDTYDPYAATPYYGQTSGVDAMNPSDVTQPDGWASSTAGVPRDTGGVGEWVTNAFKNLQNGFLGALGTGGNTARQPGGAFGTPGPGTLGRFSLPQGLNIGSSGFVWLMVLGVAFLLLWPMMGRR